MADYTSIADIVASVENATQLRTNTKQDDGTDTITGVDWFSYGDTVCSNFYANGNSWIGLGASSEHLKVNRRDAAMWNLWREEGTYSATLSSFRFLRIRWSGYTSYSSTSSSALLTYDVLFFDTGDIMLYVVDVPTSNYSGTFTLGSMSYTKPTAENRYVTFYKQADGSYVADYNAINLCVKRYLVRNGNSIYTVIDGALSEIQGTLSADLFISNGSDEIPDGSLLVGLNSPEVLCWTDAYTVPKLTATLRGLPTGTHEIVGDNTMIRDDSIRSVSSIEYAASEGATFFLSFDGSGWKVYDSSSNTWIESETGMTGEELRSVPVSAWNTVIDTFQYMQLKAVIQGADTVTQVKINFSSERSV